MTLHQPIAPRIDSQRGLTLFAFDALIDREIGKTLGHGYCARNLLERLQASGLADVSGTADRLTIRLWGVSATAEPGTALALLRAWQSAARDAIAAGVRA